MAEQAAPRNIDTRHRGHSVRNAALAIVAILGIVLLIGALLALAPAGISPRTGASQPATSFADAISRVHAIQEEEAANPAVLPDCRTKLYDHGTRTAGVVVLFHGYTNCPKQYEALAPQLAALGYTVYVPRMASHGEVPNTPGLFDSLTGEMVAAQADRAMDIADGLGDRRLVFGLSGGGAEAAYVAQFRPDADRVVAAAPFLGVPALPGWLTPALSNALRLLPPIDQREAPPDAAVRGAYPHGASDTSTHGADAYIRLGQTVIGAAGGQAPEAKQVVVVVNDADTTVNNAMVEDLASRWEKLAPDRVSVHRFDASLGVLHDMITPDREGAKTSVVYPAIIELISRP